MPGINKFWLTPKRCSKEAPGTMKSCSCALFHFFHDQSVPTAVNNYPLSLFEHQQPSFYPHMTSLFTIIMHDKALAAIIALSKYSSSLFNKPHAQHHALEICGVYAPWFHQPSISIHCNGRSVLPSSVLIINQLCLMVLTAGSTTKPLLVTIISP